MKTGLVIGGLAVVGLGVWFFVIRKDAQNIIDELFPMGFTATVEQLDTLVAAGYPQDSKIYMAAVDIAFEAVQSQCPGQVGWTSATGYYCAS